MRLINPQHSFVTFGEDIPTHCVFGDIKFCLPVYRDDDVYFQFVIEGTPEEIDGLCTQDASEIDVMLVDGCDGNTLHLFSEKPVRIRLSETQVLYYWNRGFPNFENYVSISQCFSVQIIITPSVYAEPLVYCSNCFERIAEDCFTSVIEYGSDTDSFGFKYCAGGDIEGNSISQDCDPTIIEFIDRDTLVVPYTAGLRSKYGIFPSVQVWIYDGSGNLVNMGIQVQFDGYPPNSFTADFGGNSTGIIIIR